jgi:hypothetical protein
MKSPMRLVITCLLGLFGLIGCVSQVYQPGSSDNPFNRIKLGQSYGDMVREIGNPDQSRSDDRTDKEAVLMFAPVWCLVEAAGDLNPSSVQVYTYNRWGTVTIGNNRIMRIEAKEASGQNKS